MSFCWVPNLFWGGLKWRPQRNKPSEGQIDTHLALAPLKPACEGQAEFRASTSIAHAPRRHRQIPPRKKKEHRRDRNRHAARSFLDKPIFVVGSKGRQKDNPLFQGPSCKKTSHPHGGNLGMSLSRLEPLALGHRSGTKPLLSLLVVWCPVVWWDKGYHQVRGPIFTQTKTCSRVNKATTQPPPGWWLGARWLGARWFGDDQKIASGLPSTRTRSSNPQTTNPKHQLRGT